MAVWLTLNKKYSWKTVAEISRKYKLAIGEWERYDNAESGHNSIRMGFATYNEEEIYELIERLKSIIEEMKN